MDVSEPTVRVDVPLDVSRARPAPTYQEGGSSGSGSGSNANEVNTDERDSKRVKFAQSQGQKGQGEDVEELEANAREQHPDADVVVRAHKTYTVEDVASRGRRRKSPCTALYPARPKCSRRLTKSLRQCKGVEGLNDDKTWSCAYSRLC